MSASFYPTVEWAPLPRASASPALEGSYLVLGATGGIGEACARAINAAGGQCVLLSRQVARMEQLADELEAEGGEPLLYPIDFEGAGVDDYHALADTLAAQCGPLRGVVLTAYAGGTLRPFAQLDPERWARETQVNLHAPTLLLRALWPLLQQAAPARVLMPLDALAGVTAANWTHHAVDQWARFGLMRTLAAEGRPQGVGVAGFYPGPRRTQLRAKLFGGELPTEVPEPDAIGPAVVQLLAADDAQFPFAGVVDLSGQGS